MCVLIKKTDFICIIIEINKYIYRNGYLHDCKSDT